MKKYNIFSKNYDLTPQDYIQWTIPSLLYQTSRKNPFIYKGLGACLLIRLKAVLSYNSQQESPILYANEIINKFHPIPRYPSYT